MAASEGTAEQTRHRAIYIKGPLQMHPKERWWSKPCLGWEQHDHEAPHCLRAETQLCEGDGRTGCPTAGKPPDQIFWGHLERAATTQTGGAANTLKNFNGLQLWRSPPPTPRQKDKHTFNVSSSTFTPFADKDLQRCWACLDSSGFEERGRSKLLQHPSNSSISFNSLWNTVDKKRLPRQCWTLPLTKPSSALTSTWESSALRPSHHLAFSDTQLTTFCLARISSISCTIQLTGRCSNRETVAGAIGRVMLWSAPPLPPYLLFWGGDVNGDRCGSLLKTWQHDAVAHLSRFYSEYRHDAHGYAFTGRGRQHLIKAIRMRKKSARSQPSPVLLSLKSSGTFYACWQRLNSRFALRSGHCWVFHLEECAESAA